jgi:hypothetical protein
VRADALEDGRVTEQGVASARRRSQDERACAYRLRQLRESRMARQADVAAAMKVSQSRVSRIEGGDICHSHLNTGAYVRALGGVLRVSADFGDEVLILDGPLFSDDPAAPRTPQRRRAS